MRILGVDPAVATIGYALLWENPAIPADLELIDYGVFCTEKGPLRGRLALLRAWFLDYLASRQPNLVVLERPTSNGRIAGNGLMLSMAFAELSACCDRAGVRCVDYAPNTTKKWGAKNGRATKSQVRAAMKERFGPYLKGPDDQFDAMLAAVAHAEILKDGSNWVTR